MASCAGSVDALDLATGTERWRYRTGRDGPPANFHSEPVLTDGGVSFAGDKEPEARVYAFDRGSGSVRWSRAFGGGVYSDLLRHGDDILVYTRRGDAVALRIATGEVKWTFRDGPRQTARPPSAPVLIGGRYVFAAHPADVIALDADTGAISWRATLAGDPSTSVVVAAGALLVGTRAGHFYRLDPGSGSVLARLDAGGRPKGTPVVGSGGVLALVGDSLACLDPSLEGVRWRAVNPGGWSSPRPLVRDGEVIVGTVGGSVVAFSMEGKERWRLQVTGEVRGLGSAGDVLLIGTRQGTFYAVGLAGAPQPAGLGKGAGRPR